MLSELVSQVSDTNCSSTQSLINAPDTGRATNQNYGNTNDSELSPLQRLKIKSCVSGNSSDRVTPSMVHDICHKINLAPQAEYEEDREHLIDENLLKPNDVSGDNYLFQTNVSVLISIPNQGEFTCMNPLETCEMAQQVLTAT